MAGLDIRPIETHVLGTDHDSAQCIKNLLLSDRTRLGDDVHLVAVVTRADAELDIHSEAVSLVRTVKIEVQILRREGNNQVDAMRRWYKSSAAWNHIAPFTLERTWHMTPLEPRRCTLRAALSVHLKPAMACLPLVILGIPLCRCPGVSASIVPSLARSRHAQNTNLFQPYYNKYNKTLLGCEAVWRLLYRPQKLLRYKTGVQCYPATEAKVYEMCMFRSNANDFSILFLRPTNKSVLKVVEICSASQNKSSTRQSERNAVSRKRSI